MATKITIVDRSYKEQEFGYCIERAGDVLKRLIKDYPIAKYKDFSMPLFMSHYEEWHGNNKEENLWGLSIQDSTADFGTINLSLDVVRSLAGMRSGTLSLPMSHAGSIPYGLSIQVPLIVTATLDNVVECLQFQYQVEKMRNEHLYMESVPPKDLHMGMRSLQNKYITREFNMSIYGFLQSELLNAAMEIITNYGTIEEANLPPDVDLGHLVSLDKKFLSWVEAAEVLAPDLAEVAKKEKIKILGYELRYKGCPDSSVILRVEFGKNSQERVLVWKNTKTSDVIKS